MGNATCCQATDPNAVEVMNISAEPQQAVQEPVKEAPKEKVASTPSPPPVKEDAPKEIPKDKLEVVFSTKDGERTLSFTRRPLGMNFAHKEPIAITKVKPGGHAEELGVEIGWQIKKIGEKSITDPEYKDFKVLTAYFNDMASVLPAAK